MAWVTFRVIISYVAFFWLACFRRPERIIPASQVELVINFGRCVFNDMIRYAPLSGFCVLNIENKNYPPESHIDLAVRLGRGGRVAFGVIIRYGAFCFLTGAF